MQTKNIVIICGHPDVTSYTGALLDGYQLAAEEAGHDVRRYNLGDMHFDPILHHGYNEIQHLEPDLETIQHAIIECDHLVIGYPNWWCSMPALLKGMFDRIWLPGFAFNINAETKKVEQLLKGKTSRVYVLSGTYSPLKNWWKYGDFTNEIQYALLDFAGIKAELSVYGPTERVSETRKELWLKEVAQHARKGV
jgi:NAD(P)H dehydrogenase (quinone)